MKTIYHVIVLALFLVTLGGYAGAEEKFGVSIYMEKDTLISVVKN